MSPERLDWAEDAEARANLREIALINRWFGGHRTLVRLLHRIVRPEDRFSLLDVGAASGDMGRCVQKHFRRAQVTSFDRMLRNVAAAPAPRIAGDALALPFADHSFDLVMCSSLLHHFSNNEALALLRGMQRIARRAVIALDLERHFLPYLFLPLTRPFLRWSKLTLDDGCASVAAAFRRPELEAMGSSLSPATVDVRRYRPWFRLSLVLVVPEAGRESPASLHRTAG